MGQLILVARSTANSLKEPLGSNCQLRKGRWEKPGSRDESLELVNAGFSQSGGDWLILSSRVEHHLAFIGFSSTTISWVLSLPQYRTWRWRSSNKPGRHDPNLYGACFLLSSQIIKWLQWSVRWGEMYGRRTWPKFHFSLDPNLGFKPCDIFT